jgi:hypothetical protein
VPLLKTLLLAALLPAAAAAGSAAGALPPAVQLLVVAPADVAVPDGVPDALRAMVRSANGWLGRQGAGPVRIGRDPDGRVRVATLRLAASEESLRQLGEGLMPHLAELLAVRPGAAPDPVAFAYLGRVAFRSPTHCGRRLGRFAGLFVRNDGCSGHRFDSGDGQGWDKIFLHELLHTLGAVAACAPNADGGRHVGDAGADLMHPNGGGRRPQLDVNRDDYFGHGRPDCPDLQRSALFE